MSIETKIRAAIDRAREQSSSIPAIERLFLSLRDDFPEIGISTGDSEGERACIGLMLMTLKMLMPECKAILETYAQKENQKTVKALVRGSRVIPLHRAYDGTWKHNPFNEQQKRAAELIVLYEEAAAPTRDGNRFLFETGLATRADFIEALAVETDSPRNADLKNWLNRLEPHWGAQPKMTFVEAHALWETGQRKVFAISSQKHEGSERPFSN